MVVNTLVVSRIFLLFLVQYLTGTFYLSSSVSSCLSYRHPADASAEVRGGPASPLAVQVSDVNKDYVFLTWQPPSADGASHVEGYYVEK